MSVTPPSLPPDLKARMEAAFLEDVIQYRQHIHEGLQRATRLVLSSSDLGEMADEVLRAVVVLTHAYLEDFLRQLAQAILPTADESVLNEVPLARRPRGEAREVPPREAHPAPRKVGRRCDRRIRFRVPRTVELQQHYGDRLVSGKLGSRPREFHSQAPACARTDDPAQAPYRSPR
jgi:hypothetical protein